MGQTDFCRILRFPAKICGFLQKSAPPKCCNSQEIKNLLKSAKRLRISLRLCFIGERQRKTTKKKQGFLAPVEPLNPWKIRGEHSKKQGIPCKRKKQGIPKKQRRSGFNSPWHLDFILHVSDFLKRGVRFWFQWQGRWLTAESSSQHAGRSTLWPDPGQGRPQTSVHRIRRPYSSLSHSLPKPLLLGVCGFCLPFPKLGKTHKEKTRK